jgi:branched-chain amino acid transport system substrate-binding protein
MELGMNIPIVSGDAAQTEELIKLGGKAVEGMYFTAHFNAAAVTTKLGKDFMALYKKKYNKELDGFGAMGADAYFVLINAMERAYSVLGPKVREALAATRDFQGVSGKITIGEDGNAVKAVVINQVKDGKFVYVTSMSPTFTSP